MSHAIVVRVYRVPCMHSSGVQTYSSAKKSPKHSIHFCLSENNSAKGFENCTDFTTETDVKLKS